jgi:hypothetical protein
MARKNAVAACLKVPPRLANPPQCSWRMASGFSRASSFLMGMGIHENASLDSL